MNHQTKQKNNPKNFLQNRNRNKGFSRDESKFIGVTGNGLRVYDRHNSHIKEEYPFSMVDLQKALLKVNQTRTFQKHIVDMGEYVGNNYLVKVEKEDPNIIYVIRKGRKGPTPMVKNRIPELCSKFVIILKKVRDNQGEYFVLITAFVGEESEKEPWDESLVKGTLEYKNSVEFWNTHALIYDEGQIESFV